MNAITRGDLITDDGTRLVRHIRLRDGWYRCLTVNKSTITVPHVSGHGAVRVPISSILEVQT